MSVVHFNRRLPNGTTYRLGAAVQNDAGWRFISNVASHHSSRKAHVTMKKCIPRWVGYPDRCETEVMRAEVES